MNPNGHDPARDARRMWTLVEPIHDVTYFSQEAREAYEAAGLRGFWRGYFAGRSAPFGAVGAAPIIATFYNFAPPMVHRALPDVWTRATPEAALAAREAGAVAALRRLCGQVRPEGGAVDGTLEQAVEQAADLLWQAVEALDVAGRPLGAVNAALPRPADPLARLWLAATALREHRGDGHVAALVAAGVDGCEAHLWRAADGGPYDADQIGMVRGWTPEQWHAARDRLVARGWVGADGHVTAEGRAERQRVEAATDAAAAGPWRALGPEATDRLAGLLTPLATVAAAALPGDNPIGTPPPGAGGGTPAPGAGTPTAAPASASG